MNNNLVVLTGVGGGGGGREHGGLMVRLLDPRVLTEITVLVVRT